jgi:hypothetical protein
MVIVCLKVLLSVTGGAQSFPMLSSKLEQVSKTLSTVSLFLFLFNDVFECWFAGI